MSYTVIKNNKKSSFRMLSAIILFLLLLSGGYYLLNGNYSLINSTSTTEQKIIKIYQVNDRYVSGITFNCITSIKYGDEIQAQHFDYESYLVDGQKIREHCIPL